MVYTKLFTLAALTILAVVTGVTSEDPNPILPGQCISPRTIQCCVDARNINDLDPNMRGLVESIVLLPLPDVGPLIGFSCTPATQDVNGNFSCGEGSPHPLCCANNYYGGIISIKCVPVTL
ncbi:hypothetical protein E1B28_002091 [Marasmius oreades]|uniref:Hydrophobin n=1 Tax=Marasmius oreades TaxID=181124 RepID=A0A9P7UK62_9AGAR|nr:uncharacterized protein E1B28_002091 [Marasmius oreades]KAG7086132.1 hypothetical protein E1B28_002091 [Marasmius oreades]